MRDGVEALQGDDGQGEDAELGGQHAQEAGHQTAAADLPLDGVLAELACNAHGLVGWFVYLLKAYSPVNSTGSPQGFFTGSISDK